MAWTQTTLQRLYLFQLSTTSVPVSADQTLLMSSGCYLLQTRDGTNILIDSGLPADYKPPAGGPAAEDEKNVLEHLANLGLQPSCQGQLTFDPFRQLQMDPPIV